MNHMSSPSASSSYPIDVLSADDDPAFATFPATSSQARYYADQRADPTTSRMNLAFRLKITGDVDGPAVEAALNHLIARHEVLRTGFVNGGAGLVQRVAPHHPLRLEIRDLSGLSADAAAQEAASIGRREAKTPFPLSAQSYLRAVWLAGAPGSGELLLTLHMLICDGWSFGILVRELIDVLAARAAGQTAALAPVDLHHGDYALWKAEFLESDAIAPSRDYWRETLGRHQRFEVPTDFPRPRVRGRNSVIRSTLLDAETSERLEGVTRRHGFTLFALAFAALNIALAKDSDARDIGLGMQVSARDQEELESIIGPLANSVVVSFNRSEIRGDLDFVGLCAAKAHDAITHAQLPFEDVIALVEPTPDPGRPPVYSVNFTIQNSFVGQGDELRNGGVSAVLLTSYDTDPLYDLSFFMVRRDEGWRLSCDGDLALYKVETIDRLLETWLSALVDLSLATAPAPGATGPDGAEDDWLEAVKGNVIHYHPEAPGVPIIVFNNTSILFPLAQHFASERPVIDVPMSEGVRRTDDAAGVTFSDVGADAVRIVRSIQPQGPYILMGLCVLGSLAQEAARQLMEAGEQVELVILNDSWMPGYRETMPWRDRILRRLQLRVHYLGRDLERLRRGEIALLRDPGPHEVWARLGPWSVVIRPGWGKEDGGESVAQKNRWYTDYLNRLQVTHRPAEYAGDVQIFRSQEARRGRLFAEDFGWSRALRGRVWIDPVPTAHDYMFRPEGAKIIGRILSERLAQRGLRPSGS